MYDIELVPAMPRYLDWLTDRGIEKVEKLRSCKFVGEFPVKKHSTVVGALFYQPDPPQNYSPFFFLYRYPAAIEDHPDNGRLLITSGERMDGQVLTGVITKNGHFIYSRGRHDFIEFDGSMVDGGDSYIRCYSGDEQVKFQIVKDKLMEVK